MNQQSVDVLYRQSQVGGFVLLQLHVNITKSATNKGVMTIDDDR